MMSERDSPARTSGFLGGWGVFKSPFFRAVALGIALVVFIIVVVMPRPYTIYENDVENTYLYNAKIWVDGFITQGELHPGMPARIAYLLYLKLGGPDTGPIFQRALNLGYWFIGLLYVLGATVAHRLLTSSISSAASAVGLVAGLTLPSSLYFLGYFGSDSFLVPVILPLVALTWLILDPKKTIKKWELLVAGGLAGAALSVKLSAIPLVVAVGIGITVATVAGAPGGPAGRIRGALRAVWYWVPAFLIHLMLCFPMHVALYKTWIKTLFRQETRMSVVDLGDLGREFWAGGILLWRADPVFVVVAVVSLVLLVLRLVGQMNPTRAGECSSGRFGPGRISFLVALVGSVVYGLRVSGWASIMWSNIDLAFPLRNSLPVLLGLVPLIAESVDWVKGLSPTESSCRRRTVGVWILLLVICVTGIGIHFHLRWECVTTHQKRRVAVQERFESLRPTGKRIAFWDGSPGDFFGEATFRLWGNYRWYLHPEYDIETLGMFPTLTFFHLRNVDRIIEAKGVVGLGPDSYLQGSGSRQGTSTRGWFRRLLKRLFRGTFGVWFPLWRPPDYGLNGLQLFTEDPSDPVSVGLVVWPKYEEPRELSVGRSDLLVLLGERMGPIEYWEEEIDGVKWVIVRCLGD